MRFAFIQSLIFPHTDDFVLDSFALRRSNMSEHSGAGRNAASGATISFRDKFAVSPQFKALFEEGMSLVERTAAYLDGPGRAEAKALKSPASLLYATESMRLTTRLMQLASWLLLRRAVTQGEITNEQAMSHKRRVQLVPQSRAHGEDYDALPPRLRDLVSESHRLYDRILRLDRLVGEDLARPEPAEVGAGAQVARLRLAFTAA
jgi:regulator of CtrA degradation